MDDTFASNRANVDSSSCFNLVSGSKFFTTLRTIFTSTCRHRWNVVHQLAPETTEQSMEFYRQSKSLSSKRKTHKQKFLHKIIAGFEWYKLKKYGPIWTKVKVLFLQDSVSVLSKYHIHQIWLPRIIFCF